MDIERFRLEIVAAGERSPAGIAFKLPQIIVLCRRISHNPYTTTHGWRNETGSNNYNIDVDGLRGGTS